LILNSRSFPYPGYNNVTPSGVFVIPNLFFYNSIIPSGFALNRSVFSISLNTELQEAPSSAVKLSTTSVLIINPILIEAISNPEGVALL
jgi:hypothetical protein